METTQREAKEPKWMTPLVVAICAAAFTVAVNAVVALINENLQRGLETQRSEQLRVLEAIKAGSNNQDQAAENLQFLIDVGLIRDRQLANSLQNFLRKRKSGIGPTLPFPGEVTYGCMDFTAYNYNPKATMQNGTTCLYK